MNWKRFLNELLGEGRKAARGGGKPKGAGRASAALGVQNRGGGALLRARGLPEICAIAARFVDPDTPPETPLQSQRGRLADRRARTLLRALVLAANADGHIDAAERKMIDKKLGVLGDEGQAFFRAELKRRRHTTMQLLDEEIDGPREAYEIYVLSCLVCADVSTRERRFLNQLANHLGVGPAIAREIEAEARRAAGLDEDGRRRGRAVRR